MTFQELDLDTILNTTFTAAEFESLFRQYIVDYKRAKKAGDSYHLVIKPMLNKKDALILMVLKSWDRGLDYQMIARAEVAHQKYVVKPALMRLHKSFKAGVAKDNLKIDIKWTDKLHDWVEGLQKRTVHPDNLTENQLPCMQQEALQDASQL